MGGYLADKDTKESVNFELLTYKDTEILGNFLSDQGKILPRRITGLSSKEQKKDDAQNEPKLVPKRIPKWSQSRQQ